ncbi:hypothetical protein OHA21_07810 [Actinoplanes sp. NBC_00393]|uniref:hypothetical protein n=1 Tax=Actinoplanes sp. NBC_00393 TaxID=2975953 RepID=UPI002E20DC8F
MRIRSAGVLVGITATLIVSQLVGSAFAEPKPDPTAHARELLVFYGKTNQWLATCMNGKGLEFHPGLAKADVIDAYSSVPESEVPEKIRTQIASTPDDPNEPLMATMSPQAQAAWSGAVNDCSAQLEEEKSGGAEGRARVAQAQRAAAASPEVQAAARTYVACMGGQGFTVDSDPFLVPQHVAEAEHGSSAAEIALEDRYDAAWRTCVQPYQQAFDKKLYG